MTALTISSIETIVVDLPTRRPHAFSVLEITRQSYLLVRIKTEDGVEGIGEGSTPGGPWWGGESVETMKAVIDDYLAPALIGEDCDRVEALRRKMDILVPSNNFAKAGIETALLDALGKHLGVPVHDLLGGRCRDQLQVTWALSAGDVGDVLDEVERKLDDGYRRFKLKMGALPPEEDVARARGVLSALNGSSTLIADPNGIWDELTSLRWGRELAEMGLELLEQPVPGWNRSALARLCDQLPIPVMADEGVKTSQDALTLANGSTAPVFSLKVPKSGGPLGVHRIAAIAEAAGISCFGGTTLESPIGTAACLHAYCSLPAVQGCELMGPLLLAEHVTSGGPEYVGGRVRVPTGPGLGIEIDEERLELYTRKEGAPCISTR